MFTPANGNNPPNIYYIYSDHLGAPRVVMDKANGMRWRWMAEPFGTTAAENNPAGLGAFTMNLRLPGQYFDAESGLHYNYFRNYDASTGRYTTPDPIGLGGKDVSLHAYAGGNPVTFIDPMGLKHKANSAYCKDLRKKIDNLKRDLDKRWTEMADDPLGLPERLGSGEKLSESKRGHRTLINMRDRSLRDAEKKYTDDCEQDNNDEGGGSCNECTAGAVAVTMVGGYLVYRCLRMLSSLVLPPLWPTIPANLALP